MRYHFDFDANGQKMQDKVGTVLPDLPAAKEEALAAVAEWLKDHVSTTGAELILSVRNAHTLFIVTGSIKIKPA
jgi:hypothetical protein